jgi:hypothetical protein
MERCNYKFTRREVREYTKVGDTRLKIHMHRLEELEYLIVHRGGRGQQFVYELAYNGEGQDGSTFLPLLSVPSKLEESKYDTNRSPLNLDLSQRGRPQVAVKSPPSLPIGHADFLNDLAEKGRNFEKVEKNAHLDERNSSDSYLENRTNRLVASVEESALYHHSEVQ